jgi:hypothetical protein
MRRSLRLVQMPFEVKLFQKILQFKYINILKICGDNQNAFPMCFVQFCKMRVDRMSVIRWKEYDKNVVEMDIPKNNIVLMESNFQS